ncbi:hypothetical protein OsJ_24535 [Oryza sativa Japonica Group]|uniref:KIB1-4 beta-propeller domain-containing protein n=1 Tax=Oryza sativa subsp. japonica TaxID=39947 RepID=A3BKK2_ORYSJ|nr:hypothetical protein OsJ_24535 [Oryza sativa Japonica Group]
MGPTLGGLLTLRERGGAHVLRLLHPFTRHLTELPSLVTMIHAASHDPKMVEPEYHQPTAIGLSDDHKAVAVFCGLVNKVAVARPGDSHWKWVYVPHFHLESAASLAGCFYAVSHVYIYQLESDGARGEPKLVPVAYVPVDAPSFRLTLVADDERERLMLMKEVFYVHAGEEVPPEGARHADDAQGVRRVRGGHGGEDDRAVEAGRARAVHGRRPRGLGVAGGVLPGRRGGHRLRRPPQQALHRARVRHRGRPPADGRAPHARPRERG